MADVTPLAPDVLAALRDGVNLCPRCLGRKVLVVRLFEDFAGDRPLESTEPCRKCGGTGLEDTDRAAPTDGEGTAQILDNVCSRCGYGMGWEECGECGGEGEVSRYDEDPLWYNENDLFMCELCQGWGGWYQCFDCIPEPEASPWLS